MATALFAAAALAFPALAGAAATASEGGAELGSLAGSPGEALSYWTPARLEDAEPLPIVTLPGPPPEAAATAALARPAAARAAAIEGIEVGAGESTIFPNSANGKLYGVFEIFDGNAVEIEKYQCSGSVVDSPWGNVVLTAGHCVVDPRTGTVASKGKVIFIPGFRECSAPFGAWEAVSYATTETWKKTAGRFFFGQPMANEGGDMALLTVNDNEAGESLEEAAGSLEMGFEGSRSQVYTQYGYPAEPPYGGEVLYSHTAAYAGADPNFFFSPAPMKIASDFTEGASGGPWTAGPSDSPTVLSLTAYRYEQQPGYLYGPYFGDEARAAYEQASARDSGPAAAPDLEALCRPSREISPPSEEQPPNAPNAPSQGTPPPAAQPSPPAAAPTPVTLRLTRIHRRANGSAVLTTRVGSAGKLRLRGSAVRTETVNAPAAGKYRLIVAAKGRTNRKLQRKGRVKVGVKVAFRASGKTRRISRSLRLSRRTVERPMRHHSRHFR